MVHSMAQVSIFLPERLLLFLDMKRKAGLWEIPNQEQESNKEAYVELQQLKEKASIAVSSILIIGLSWLWGAAQEQKLQQRERHMKITRVYTGADGKSHFEDIEVPLKDGGKAGFMSELMKATGVVFRETDGSYNFDFHNAPRRQYVVNLEGEVEIEVGDGTKRILRSGDILLAEDTTGQGHISRAVGGKPRKSLFITLD